MENQQKITFVSCFLNIYEKYYDYRDTQWRMERFEEIASTGIQICLFISKCYENQIQNLTEKYKNVKIMQTIELTETFVYKMYEQQTGISLPDVRNEGKDTKEYILLMNSKTEYMKQAIQENPWNSTHFSWIDFNISHIFLEKEKSQEYLKNLESQELHSTCLFVPGCWQKLHQTNISFLFNEIHWRFCGGFFIGDAKSILAFHDLYEEFFPIFLQQYKKLIWEVNFWSWLESTQNWNPNWFLADHNDSMIKIPNQLSCFRIFDSTHSIIQYNYPEIQNFLPDSSCYLFYQGKHYLNTRYINYEIQHNGSYLYKTGKPVIENINILSELNSELNPISFNIMKDTIELPSNIDSFSFGLEDIRLFEFQHKIHFIATNVNHSLNGKIRMMTGMYDIESYDYKDCKMIEPPYDTYCEKNWIPIVSNEEVFFIYKWFPLEMGRINPENNTLEIVKQIPIQNPLFQRVRGSSPFVADLQQNGHLVGVVHFSEETVPRKYFHLLVLLEKETLQPLKYTEIFFFEKMSIEFCIGFTIMENQYTFWISRMDRDPLLVSIERNKIPFCYDFV